MKTGPAVLLLGYFILGGSLIVAFIDNYKLRSNLEECVGQKACSITIESGAVFTSGETLDLDDSPYLIVCADTNCACGKAISIKPADECSVYTWGRLEPIP